jgi:hypothetical protein
MIGSIINAAMKQNGGEDESEIHTAVRKSVNSSQKQAIITNYFSK